MQKNHKKPTKREMKKHLKGLEKITDFLKIIFASGFINEKPLSCILVAPVSSGKTTTIKQFKNNKNILVTTDSTAWGILSEHQNALKNKEIRHIVIPDLLNSLARRKTTADALIMFINATSEDGLFPSNTFGMKISDYIEPFGWVLCLTTDAYLQKYKFLKNIGFISRFFVIEYSYTKAQIEEILNDIINEVTIQIPEQKINGGKKIKKIKGNENVFKELLPFSKVLAREGESEVLRTQRQLQIFLKANAYLRKDDTVKRVDLEKLKELIDLIR